jgi:hypothetical protein
MRSVTTTTTTAASKKRMVSQQRYVCNHSTKQLSSADLILISRLATDRIVGSPISEYELFFQSGSEMRFNFKIIRNDRNVDPPR